MRVTLLGSGDAFGSGGRFHTCLHVAAAGAAPILVDCGASAHLALARSGLDRNALSAVAITHFHGDHFGGLPYLLLDFQYALRRTAPLLLAGPPGVEARVKALVDACYPDMWPALDGFPIRFQEIAPGASADVAGYRFTAFAMRHDPRAGDCLGYRIEAGGKTFAFTGDTAWTEAIVPLAADADLLLTECYTLDRPLPVHLDYATLERRLPDLTAKRIVVTHMSPDLLFHDGPLKVERAHDGLELDL